MKNLYLVILLFNFLLLTNCNKNQKKSISTNQIDSSNSADLVNLAINYGDTDAYDKLSIEYMDSPYSDFLEISRQMANKHEYKAAYMDVFYCLTNYYQNKDENLFKELDNNQKNMAIKYLELAAKKGEVNSLELLSKFYAEGKDLTRNIELSKNLLKKRDSILGNVSN